MGSGGGGEPANLLGLSPEEISAVYARDTAGESQRFNMGAQVINALTGERSADLEALKFEADQSQRDITNTLNRDILDLDKKYKADLTTDKEAKAEIAGLKARLQEIRDQGSADMIRARIIELEDRVGSRGDVDREIYFDDKSGTYKARRVRGKDVTELGPATKKEIEGTKEDKPIQSAMSDSMFEMVTDSKNKYIGSSISSFKDKKADIEKATKGEHTMIVVDLEAFDPWLGGNTPAMQIPFKVKKGEDFKESTLISELAKYGVSPGDAKIIAEKWFKKNKLVNLE